MLDRLYGSSLGLIIKLIGLAAATGLLGWMTFVAVLKKEWLMVVVLAAIIVSLNYVYLTKKTVASKFFLPGLIFLLIFMIAPVIYTTIMSGYNYKIGNLITKEEAIDNLINSVGLVPDEQSTQYDMYVGKIDGKEAAIFTNQTDKTVWLGQDGKATQLQAGQYTADANGVANSVPGFMPYTDEELATNEKIITEARYNLPDGSFIVAQDQMTAGRLTQTLFYDKAKDQIADKVNGITYVNNGKGNFVNQLDKTQMLMPGWRQNTWLSNYTSIFTEKKMRDPFIRVFIWTFAFAFITVIMMFGLGLVLAIALDKKIRFRNFYRSILILPYAMPSFMSILIWAGMFNRQYGLINSILHTNIDWLNSPWTARGVILLVNLWLGFPYFYLISTGALQALPGDLEEAASIDGASGNQIFWRIKLPLVLQILSPMLIASFAFNFNNFNLVYLLTKGGPTDVLGGETAGATDLLITYAYKTAFAANNQNYGLASAVSVIVFIIVGALSMWSLKRSKVLEEIK